MPMPVVAPKPSLPIESRLGAPLLAQEASYLAASARISSLSVNSIAHPYTVFLYSISANWRDVRHHCASDVPGTALRIATAGSSLVCLVNYWQRRQVR